jgi:hypothetical protein
MTDDRLKSHAKAQSRKGEEEQGEGVIGEK